MRPDVLLELLFGPNPICVKAVAFRLIVVLAFVGCSLACADANTLRTFKAADVVGNASGVGSRATVILRDGTVCAIDPVDPSECSALGTLPAVIVKIISDNGGRFDGVFDLLGDHFPQVFVDFWPESDDQKLPSALQQDSQWDQWPCGLRCDGPAGVSLFGQGLSAISHLERA
jgi:hypothetical protein